MNTVGKNYLSNRRELSKVRMILLPLIIFGLVLGVANAEDETKSSKMFDYLEAAGIHEAMEQTRADYLVESERQIHELFHQVQDSIPGIISDKMMEEIDSMMTEILEISEAAYTVDEVLRVYAGVYDKNYPGEDLDQAIAKLSSPEGQLLTSTIHEAIRATNEFTTKRDKATWEEITQIVIAWFQKLKSEQERQSKEQEE